MSKLRAAFFDLDGTLKLDRDPYRFIHRSLGWGEKTQQFAEMYKRGEIDSDEWIRRDVRLWRGLRRDFLAALVGQIPYTPGARQVVAELKRIGALVVVVSTGPQFHADLVKAELDLDCAIANEVVFEAGVATGEVIIYVHEADKAGIVADLLAKRGISRDECLAVGDGEADVGMFAVCRLGVAVQPVSERVRRSAQIVLDRPDLSRLLAAVYRLVPEWQSVAPREQETGQSCLVANQSERGDSSAPN
jgi:phosphoserine phosphatase